MQNTFIPPELIISYWIFIWFVLYVLASRNKNTEIGKYIYENTNPIFLFLVGFLGNICMLGGFLLYNPKIRIIVTYILEITILKALPIWFLWQQKIKVVENLMFSVLFVFLYLSYLFFLGENVMTIYERINQSILKNENKTPLFYYLDLLYSKFV